MFTSLAIWIGAASILCVIYAEIEHLVEYDILTWIGFLFHMTAGLICAYNAHESKTV